MKGTRLVSLELANLVAGTKYRGEFEERLQAIVEELTNPKAPPTILFIDEIHNLVGAGAAEGGMDAANLLKPALARGELQLIGATTIAEYRKVSNYFYTKDDTLLYLGRLKFLNFPPRFASCLITGTTSTLKKTLLLNDVYNQSWSKNPPCLKQWRYCVQLHRRMKNIIVSDIHPKVLRLPPSCPNVILLTVFYLTRLSI